MIGNKKLLYPTKTDLETISVLLRGRHYPPQPQHGKFNRCPGGQSYQAHPRCNSQASPL